MNNFTPAQKTAIQGWTEQRDTLLREIGILTTDLGTLRGSTKAEGLALADLHKSISEARGRLGELEALELRHKGSVTIEVSNLEARKSRLEAECAAIRDTIAEADKHHAATVAHSAELSDAHKITREQAAIVNSITAQIIDAARIQGSDTKAIMAEIKAVMDQVIDKGNANVGQANIILEKLPRYVFELQKPIPVRRTYAAPRGTVIEPATNVTPTANGLKKN